jgi:hypothetical protein
MFNRGASDTKGSILTVESGRFSETAIVQLASVDAVLVWETAAQVLPCILIALSCVVGMFGKFLNSQGEHYELNRSIL